MAVIDVITKEDLALFKSELIRELKELIVPATAPARKKWLRSREVKELLQISSGTLQNLRVTGVLEFTRIGGTLFYDAAVIGRLLPDKKGGTGVLS